MESLVKQLNQYSEKGIPNSKFIKEKDEVDESLYMLEEDWRSVVNPSGLSEKQQQRETAIWELMTTEVAYIKTLRVVTELFAACLESLQLSGSLTDIDKNKLFSNITEILECNSNFWREHLHPYVSKMKKTGVHVNPVHLQEGFCSMPETYCSYFKYCAEQARCQNYCKELNATNEAFTAYLVWCETRKECNRLRLIDILVRPMQRLTKYGLLLKAIQKNTEDPDEKESLSVMIRSVDEFVNCVNTSLRQKQDFERIKAITSRIESYDVVDVKDEDVQAEVNSYSVLDLTQPMVGCPSERKRHLLLEGDLKLKELTATSKTDVHCFLLTDVLLVCKALSKKGGAMRIIRQPYMVDRLVVKELQRETPSLSVVYLSELRTACCAFMLQNNDQRKLQTWVESIRKAKKLYEQAKHAPLANSRQLSTSAEQLALRAEASSSSRASLARSHSGSVEMNDQSSTGKASDIRTPSVSSDEGGVGSGTQKHTLLGQSLPNLALPAVQQQQQCQNTLLVPGRQAQQHLLSPGHRGVSYPPPSPGLRRGYAIQHGPKNPPLLKTGHVDSNVCSFDLDTIPVVISGDEEQEMEKEEGA